MVRKKLEKVVYILDISRHRDVSLRFSEPESQYNIKMDFIITTRPSNLLLPLPTIREQNERYQYFVNSYVA